MESVRLTKSAEYLLCVLYDSYLQRVKNGESSSRAKSFGGSGQIKDNFIPEGNIIVIIIISVILFIAGFISSFAIAILDKQKDKVEEVEYVEDKNR